MSIQQPPTKTVVILCKTLPHYRKTFFERLRQQLLSSGILLRIIYGQGRPVDQSKQDSVELPWGEFVPNKILRLCNRDFVWQPVLKESMKADLVIAEQANALMVNHVLQILQCTGRVRLAFWGHGKNFQATKSDALSERLKRMLATHVWWWFAYTEGTKNIVENLGYPPERITVVQNAIDTKELIQLRKEFTPQTLSDYRAELGVSENTAVFCGGIYKEKRMEFLIDACLQIRQAVPDFNLLIIGSGPEKEFALKAANKYDWIKYLGPLFDKEKAKAYGISKLVLMPGLVGLGILDSFALQVPMITTDVEFHSPEIAYLESGRNGIMTPNDVNAFSEQAIRLLQNAELLARLKSGAAEAASLYTLEAMVDNFASGVKAALNAN